MVNELRTGMNPQWLSSESQEATDLEMGVTLPPLLPR